MCLAWDLRSGCLNVMIKKVLISTNNRKGFDHDLWEISDSVKYISNDATRAARYISLTLTL